MHRFVGWMIFNRTLSPMARVLSTHCSSINPSASGTSMMRFGQNRRGSILLSGVSFRKVSIVDVVMMCTIAMSKKVSSGDAFEKTVPGLSSSSIPSGIYPSNSTSVDEGEESVTVL